METDIKIIETVDSTNTEVRSLADKGAPEGTCVMSFMQRCGQGRSGRTFYSPECGNLYMSLLLRCRNRMTFDMITPTAAVATVEGIKDHFGIQTGIKWVNDIMLGGRKVCGIIAKAENFGTDDQYVILGTGINIYEPEVLPDDIKDKYGSLLGKKCDRTKADRQKEAEGLGRAVLKRFIHYYESCDHKDIIDRYRKYCMFIGKRVEYLSGENVYEAVAAGIDDNGSVLLEHNGLVRAYSDGEIRITVKDK